MADLSMKNYLVATLELSISVSGTIITESEVTQYTKDGARAIVKILKQQGAVNELKYFLKKVAGCTSNSCNIAQGGDHNVQDGSLMMVLRKHNSFSGTPYFACREVEQTQEAYVQLPTSVEFATKEHPVYLRTSKSLINIYPVPTSNDTVDIYAFDMFDGLDKDDEPLSGDSVWNHFLKQYGTALQYYCAERCCMAMVASETVDLGAMAWSPTSIVGSPTIPDTLYGIGDLPTAPVYSGPTAVPDYSRVNTFLDDDDSELSATAVQKVQMELTQYAQDIQDATAKYSAEAKEYDNTLSYILKEADGVSATEIASHQNSLTKYASQVQDFINQVQEESLKFQAETASHSAAMQGWVQMAQMYGAKFSEFMMVQFPKPQQQGGGRRAG